MNTAIVKMLANKVLIDNQRISEMTLGTGITNEYLDAIELWSYINSKILSPTILNRSVLCELIEGERRLKE